MCMSLMFLTPQLIDICAKRKYLLYPSLACHNGKVWVLGKSYDGLNVPTVEDHLCRMYDSVIARNIFPLTRRPFCHDDTCRNFFVQKLLIPKLQRKVEGKDEVLGIPYNADLVEQCALIGPEVTQCEAAIEVIGDPVALELSIINDRARGGDNLRDFFEAIKRGSDLHLKVLEVMRRDGNTIANRFDDYISPPASIEMHSGNGDVVDNVKKNEVNDDDDNDSGIPEDLMNDILSLSNSVTREKSVNNVSNVVTTSLI